MKEYVLNYYPKFKCIAGSCKHTCCAGWEMCIDKESLLLYAENNTEFFPTLVSGIDFKKSKFRYDKNKRCAFLNDKGLCDIIINLGEQSLCQVCRDHPRFRSFFSDKVELGLGFCCEQATDIILSFTDKIDPLLTSNDNMQAELDFNEQNVISFRQKALNILQDRSTEINDRITSLLNLCCAGFTTNTDKKILKTFLAFERLNKSWTAKLKSIKNKPLVKTVSPAHALYCEQFLVNSIYRHLSSAEDTMWVRARTIACIVSWWLIQSLFTNLNADFNQVKKIVRSFSAEVEYSQKNLDKLFDFCYKFIKLN